MFKEVADIQTADILLNMDKRENEIVGGEMDEGGGAEIEPMKKAVSYER